MCYTVDLYPIFYTFCGRYYAKINQIMPKSKHLQRLTKPEIPRKTKKCDNDKSIIYLPRQCLRNGEKALILLGFLGGNVEFTPYLHLWKIGSEKLK